MAAPLQAKIQLLGALFVAFTLLGAPLFFQVRADAQEDRTRAENTWFAKQWKDFMKFVQGDKEDDIEVEDYWGDQGQNHPCNQANPPPECNPNGDYDNDGMSNEEELRQDRNPNCNEETEPYPGYCAGEDPPLTPTTTPPITARTDVLHDDEDPPVKADHNHPFTVPGLVPNYDQWIVTWDVSNFIAVDPGGQYRVVIEYENNQTQVCCDPGLVPFPEGSDEGSQTLSGVGVPLAGTTYRIRIESSGFEGDFAIKVIGIRNAR